MNCTNHALERYCQRVKGMPEADSKTYSRSKKGEVEKALLQMFEESVLFWHGSYNGTFSDTDYYFNRSGYILIVDKENIITIYATDYGFDAEIDLKIAKDLFNKTNKLKQKYDKVLVEKQIKVSQKEMEIENINNQLELLQMQKNKLLAEKDIIVKDISIKKKELDDTALKLINSLQFRMELMSMKNKKAS